MVYVDPGRHFAHLWLTPRKLLRMQQAKAPRPGGPQRADSEVMGAPFLDLRLGKRRTNTATGLGMVSGVTNSWRGWTRDPHSVGSLLENSSDLLLY